MSQLTRIFVKDILEIFRTLTTSFATVVEKQMRYLLKFCELPLLALFRSFPILRSAFLSGRGYTFRLSLLRIYGSLVRCFSRVHECLPLSHFLCSSCHSVVEVSALALVVAIHCQDQTEKGGNQDHVKSVLFVPSQLLSGRAKRYGLKF